MVDFYNHLAKNFNKSNLAKGVSGKIYLKFIIDKDEQITGPKVLTPLLIAQIKTLSE